MPTDRPWVVARWNLIVLCVMLVLISAGVLWRLSDPALTPTGLIALHAGSIALVGVVALAITGRKLALQLTLWTAVAGTLGALIWLAAVAAARGEPQNGDHFPDLMNAQIHDEGASRLNDLRANIRDDRVRLNGAHEIKALCDIFLGDCDRSKLNALVALARNYDRCMAPALALALSSRDAAVRVLGASVLARLQQRHADTVTTSAARTELEPRSADAWRALAHAHMTFARSGLLNRERQLEAIARARHAEACAQAHEADARTPLALPAASQSAPRRDIAVRA